ncbi:23S rRNA (uracil(1939)-C(5))-methyltransferase RlmD [Hydromonas duriensis]|uniref:23S rRNA (uracil(1939)-C(5))-methyltransferase RlmD n=1 Tax=Hydromonas duriensis TaxID=1527608 RepID=A0A4R6YC14_9BURK|nr:23S rRNA (uracil(1939)-C(5))-methyltransferase RlmD [Hydromonas duriensis]TDR33154.1 23S rRNA m(5)U-1939 methyltransferase [Hydromonas duriensis]
MGRRKKEQKVEKVFPVVQLTIESLDMEGRGIAHHDGKVVFVEGALPFEEVRAHVIREKSNYNQARTTEVLRASSERVKPKCAAYGVCGGCAMQHINPRAQVAAKQRVLEDNLQRIGQVRPEIILRPIAGPTWGYRYRARLSVRNVHKKGQVLVGFREKNGSYVANMLACEVLPKHISDLLPKLRELIAATSVADHIPQIEVAIGQDSNVLVFRHMLPLNADDERLLRDFSETHHVDIWLQPKGVETVHAFHPTDSALYYDLPEFGIRMPYRPTDFTQVNFHINRVLVARAIRLLEIKPNERVADFFCGLGNFTLPLATQATHVIGIEGSTQLTQRALENAQVNGVADKTEFYCRNLFEVTADDLRSLGAIDKYLVDPPRDGADALCRALAELTRQEKPRKIVYVSCNPSTLARDAHTLVHQAGYRLVSAGVVNMFPHTAHVESMAVFELQA